MDAMPNTTPTPSPAALDELKWLVSDGYSDGVLAPAFDPTDPEMAMIDRAILARLVTP